MCGQSTVSSKTGLTKSGSKKPFLEFLLLLLTLVSNAFSFTSLNMDIVIGSHNLHNFKTSVAYHKKCLTTLGGVWMGQELWLSEKQLTLLHQLGTSFFARSGMEQSLSSGVMRGRPHGEVSIAWSPNLNDYIQPLSNYKHKRVVAVELKSPDRNFILISVYLPFFDSD